jgi:hypothetical protein
MRFGRAGLPREVKRKRPRWERAWRCKVAFLFSCHLSPFTFCLRGRLALPKCLQIRQDGQKVTPDFGSLEIRLTI